jgi:hypothetical protein
MAVMQPFVATKVELNADLEYGEGRIRFRWPDQMSGEELLEIDCDGHCSRRMPIYSGTGPPRFIVLERNRVVIQFSATLAKQLRLEEEIEITFSISDDDFQKLVAFREFYEV